MDALVRQTERDELGDLVVTEIPADRAGALGQQLDHAEVRERVGLQAAQLTRPHQPVEAGGMELLDQRFRQALLALDLIAIAADDRPQSGGGLNQRLSVDIGRQARVFGNPRHRVSSQIECD
jgi:hypothetical protein